MIRLTPTHIPEKFKPLFELTKAKGFGIYVNTDLSISFTVPSGRRIGRFSDLQNALRYLEKQPYPRKRV